MNQRRFFLEILPKWIITTTNKTAKCMSKNENKLNLIKEKNRFKDIIKD